MDIAYRNTLGNGIHAKQRSRRRSGMTPADAVGHGTLSINLDVEGYSSSGVSDLFEFGLVTHGYPASLLAAQRSRSAARFGASAAACGWALE